MTTKLPGAGPDDWLEMPFDAVPTYDDCPGRISITTSPPPCRRMSPVITAAGQTALVSVKYSPPPPQTGPAVADTFGGQTNSKRLPLWPRSETAVAVQLLPDGPEPAAGSVAVVPAELVCPVTARSSTFPVSTPLFVCSRAVVLPCSSSRACAAFRTTLPLAGDEHG